MAHYTDLMSAIEIIRTARRTVKTYEPAWDTLYHAEIALKAQADKAMKGVGA